MIVETSALIAMLRDEPEKLAFVDAIAGASAPLMSAATYLETGIVVDSKRDPATSFAMDGLINALGKDIVSVTVGQARLARQAYRDFGKGSGHPAKLNFGDCFAYALAVERGEPLLFKGNDFTHTGIARA